MTKVERKEAKAKTTKANTKEMEKAKEEKREKAKDKEEENQAREQVEEPTKVVTTAMTSRRRLDHVGIAVSQVTLLAIAGQKLVCDQLRKWRQLPTRRTNRAHQQAAQQAAQVLLRFPRRLCIGTPQSDAFRH